MTSKTQLEAVSSKKVSPFFLSLYQFYSSAKLVLNKSKKFRGVSNNSDVQENPLKYPQPGESQHLLQRAPSAGRAPGPSWPTPGSPVTCKKKKSIPVQTHI